MLICDKGSVTFQPICSESPVPVFSFSALYHAASELRTLLKSGNPNRLTKWIQDYEHTPIEQLRRFVHGIKMDIKASTKLTKNLKNNRNWKRQYLDDRLFQSSLHRQGEHKAGSLFRIRCV